VELSWLRSDAPVSLFCRLNTLSLSLSHSPTTNLHLSHKHSQIMHSFKSIGFYLMSYIHPMQQLLNFANPAIFHGTSSFIMIRLHLKTSCQVDFFLAKYSSDILAAGWSEWQQHICDKISKELLSSTYA